MNDVGLKVQLNGPFTFSPDGNPLVGPVEGTGLAMRHGSNARSNGPPAADGDGDVHNFWAACAVMAGFSQGTFEPSSSTGSMRCTHFQCLASHTCSVPTELVVAATKRPAGEMAERKR